jgi:hypothetical protein
LAVLMPIFSITLVFWAEERAARQAAALAHVLRELGKGFEAAIAGRAVDPASVANGSAILLTSSEVGQVMSSADMPGFISLSATRDFTFEFLVGRQDSGPVEGVIVLNAVTDRGSGIIERLRNRGLHVSGQGSQNAASGDSSVVNLFLSASGASAISDTRFGFSSADFAELSPARVIRQERRVTSQTVASMDATINMNGHSIVSADEVEVTTFDTTSAVSENSGLTTEDATLQSLQVEHSEAGPSSFRSLNVAGSISAASADATGTVRAARAAALDHTTFERINVTSLLTGSNFIASSLTFTSGLAHDYSRDTWQLISSRVTNLRARISMLSQSVFSDAASVNDLTVGGGCRGC